MSSVGPSASMEVEAVRRELNERIDEIADSIQRRERGLERSKRELVMLRARKRELDEILQREVERYDSAFVDSIRQVDGEVATLVERNRFLEKLRELPRAIDELEQEAGSLQGVIDRLGSSIRAERARLRKADDRVAAIARHFKRIMLKVGFPGVSDDDKVVVDPRTWRPTVEHDGQQWNFWDAGSGGKKTLFNVCYALAVHAAGVEHAMPVPRILVIDSPTKNISGDEDPELVRALYREIYRLAAADEGERTQFLLIDSNLVEVEGHALEFQQHHMAGVPGAPSLISYYKGP